MPTTKSHKTRHHSNLRPSHRQTQKYLNVYWPYIPLLAISILILSLLRPWSGTNQHDVLAYSTDISAASLLRSTNNQRVNYQESPLSINKKLAAAAQAKANDMVKRDYWSHTSPDGREPWAFVSNKGYNYEHAGENLAYGFLTSQDVVAGWMNSQSHRENVLNSNYSEVGFGYANSPDFSGKGNSTVVVAMYGKPASSTSQEADQGFVAAKATTPKSISKIQTITGGSAPYSSYIIGILIGAALMYLAIKHSLQLKKALKKGEKFAVKHPVLDITIVAGIVLLVLLAQSSGMIL